MSAHIELTEADAAGGVSVPMGGRLHLTLPQRGGTGYLWTVRELPDCLTPITDELRAPTAAAGSTGQRHWTWRAVAPGTGTLRLELARPWAGGGVDRTWQVDVTVPV